MSVETPDRDWTKAHPLLVRRWGQLGGVLFARIGKTMVNEIYRADARQAWLYGQGRTAAELQAVGLDPMLARPGPRVTNAWSAKLSAHGHQLDDGTPASCALDLVPLGADDKPWSADDPWDELVRVVAEESAKVGLRHFHKPGKAPTDTPHVQLVEWNDALHRLIL